MTDRHKSILRLLSQKQELTVADLSAHFQVSGVTIRQDLDHLQNQGLLRRVHGGAVLHNDDEISTRIGINYERKNAIAEKAMSFLQSGETIFIESGSANALFARHVKSYNDFNVVTNNLFVARTLKDSDINVITLGGLYQHQSESIVGKMALSGLESLNFSKCFIGVDGFTFEQGFTCSDMMRAEVANAAAKRSQEVFVLTDSSKFGRIALTHIFDLAAVDHIITDCQIPAEYRSGLEKHGTSVHICET